MIGEKLKTWLMLIGLAAALVAAGACGSSNEDDPGAEPAEEADAGDAGTQDETQTTEKPQLPEGPPVEGFQQLMPRGGIPALFDPQFVSAADAEIPDEAWVMGFEHDGQAYAYDLNTLNHHEVVNHKIGELPIAAVW